MIMGVMTVLLMLEDCDVRAVTLGEAATICARAGTADVDGFADEHRGCGANACRVATNNTRLHRCSGDFDVARPWQCICFHNLVTL